VVVYSGNVEPAVIVANGSPLLYVKLADHPVGRVVEESVAVRFVLPVFVIVIGIEAEKLVGF
jgi:hypothetical protein